MKCRDMNPGNSVRCLFGGVGLPLNEVPGYESRQFSGFPGKPGSDPDPQ